MNKGDRGGAVYVRISCRTCGLLHVPIRRGLDNGLLYCLVVSGCRNCFLTQPWWDVTHSLSHTSLYCADMFTRLAEIACSVGAMGVVCAQQHRTCSKIGFTTIYRFFSLVNKCYFATRSRVAIEELCRWLCVIHCTAQAGRQAGKQADCSSSLPFYMRKTSRQAIYSRFYSEIFNDSIIAVCICTAPEILILLTRVQIPVEPTSNFLPLTFFILPLRREGR